MFKRHKNEKIELEEVSPEQQACDARNYKICLAVFFISALCLLLFNKFDSVFFFAALVSIVTGFIKFPKSKLIKVLFWVFIAATVFYIVITVLLVASCIGLFTQVDFSVFG